MRTRLTTFATAALVLAAAAPARAAFAPVTSAGPDAASIQPAVDAYRAGLGPDNLAAAGSQPGGRREINWDGVPDASALPASLPPSFFNVTSPRGLVLATAGRGFAVSRRLAQGDPAAVRFGDVDPSYGVSFETFSAERLLAPLGANVSELTFRVPGTDTPALVSGFAAVFTDVDVAGATRLDYFGADGAPLGTVAAGVAPGGLSFAGASGAPIAHVRVTTGNAPLAPGTRDDAAHDVVAMDDFVYGEPRQPLADYHLAQDAYAAHEGDGRVQLVVRRSGALGAGSVHIATGPWTADAGEDYGAIARTVSFAPGESAQVVDVPLITDTGTEGDEAFVATLDSPVGGTIGSPAAAIVVIHDDPKGKTTQRPDRARPKVRLSGVASKLRRSRFVKGVRVKVRTNEAASLDASLIGSARRAVISRRNYDLTLAHRHSAAARGTRTLRLKPSRRLLGSARRFDVRLRVLAVDSAGNRRTATWTIRVR